MVTASMTSIDRSIINVSLPVMRRDFQVELNEIEWVVTAYMLAFLFALPLMNWLKSRVGYYTLMMVCLTVFIVGSICCSLAPTLSALIFCRALQAVSGGILTPMSMSILSETLPPEEKGSAIAWWGIGNVTGLAIGPTLGGFLSHYFGWPFIFYINIPLGVWALVLVIRYLSFLKEVPRQQIKFDFIGYILFLSFILTAQQWVWMISTYPLTHIFTWVFLLIVVGFLYLYIRSANKENALLDLNVFRYALFNRSAMVIFLRSVALFGGMFYLPFLLQGELGYSEMETGLLMLPNALLVLVTRPYSGKLADKGKIRNITLLGIAMLAVSFLFFATLKPGVASWWIVLIMIFRGIGMGFLVAPVSTSLLGSVQQHQTATATTLNSLILQLGGSLGIAVSGVFYQLLHDHYLPSHSAVEADHFALKGSFLIAAVLIMAAFIPAWKLPEGGMKKTEVKDLPQ